MNFQEKIKAVRQQLNLTQEELAHELGVTFATVNRWETGVFKPSKMAKKIFEDYCRQHNVAEGM
jgi:DNA-binding transcriptional regulator YiaG